MVEGLKNHLKRGHELSLPFHGKVFQVRVIRQHAGQTTFRLIYSDVCPQFHVEKR